MKNAILTPAEKQVIDYHARTRAARQILLAALLAVTAALIALHTALLAAQRYQPAPPAVEIRAASDGHGQAAIPADWTENPLAGVVYEPASESGAGRE